MSVQGKIASETNRNDFMYYFTRNKRQALFTFECLL